MNPIRVVHVIYFFGIGGLEKGITTLINHESDDIAHIIISLCGTKDSEKLLKKPAQVESFGGVPVTDCYGSREGGFVCHECREGKYHVIELNIGGFQIDRGKGQHERIRYSKENDFPFYAGHVADKGYLYLKGKDKDAVTRKPGLLERPVCL